MNILVLPAWYDQSDQIKGSFIREQALALGASGATVTIAEYYWERKWPFQLRTETIQLSENVKTVRIYFPVISPLRLTRIFYRYYRRRVARRLESWLKSLPKYDVIHLQSVLHPMMPYLAFELSHRLNIPMILSEHYTSFSKGERGLNYYTDEELFEKFVPHTQLRFSPSPTASQFHSDFFGRPFDFLYPIAGKIFEAPLQENNSAEQNDTFRFLSVGKLSARKGHDILLKAFHQAFKGQAGVKLQLAGDANAYPLAHELVESLGLEPQVEFLGAVTPPELVQLLDSCHAMVMASRKETFGVVALEALLRGRPVVTTQSGGPEQLLTDKCGLVCTNEDIDGLAQAMIKLKSEIADYDRQELRAHAMATYSRQAFAQKFFAESKKLR